MIEIPSESRGEASAQAGASLSIGDVAEATGIAVDTLRVWERRYGRPQAVRLPSGHRRYSLEQVTFLRRVAEGLARGHKPSALLRLDHEELTALLVAEGQALDAATTELVDHLRHFRREEIVAALERDWRRMKPRVFLEERIAPLLEGAGRLWADGDLEVRHEHFLSETLEDVLRSLRMALPSQDADSPIVLATLSGEGHRLALLMLALLTTLHGHGVRLIGSDTPNEEIVEAVRETDAWAVVVSVSLATGGVDTDRRLAVLRAMLDPETRLVVGGAGARGPRRGRRGIEYVDDLTRFEAWLSSRSR